MKQSFDVIIVGSGAAAFSTADWLVRYGIEDICIFTENINYGTSRNTGSDKQTYYKLDTDSPAGDSIGKMASDLFSGGAMNGYHALCEAAGSVRCFMRLVELGVPFPSDEFGRYPGYKTDHDSSARATSAGPLTSKYMTEKLEKKVKKNNTCIADGYQLIKLITKKDVCRGAVFLHENKTSFFSSKAVILCTGAPAWIYADRVYPVSQCGATGVAIEAGASLSNFQEWQFGIASVSFRWNLSGSYQQVIPRYFSVDEDGREYDFLSEAIETERLFGLIFLKGYQWPFDSKKLPGSSEIDILVYKEHLKRRRVFIDYRREPSGFSFEALPKEAYDYLEKTDCLCELPIERLKKLNPKAIKLYQDNGIDLSLEPLEIGVCAQHNNGGLTVDEHYETTVKNLFAAGEAAGVFGVYRPGGSALNDTQVSGLFIAKYLSGKIKEISISIPEFDLPKIPLLSKISNLKQLRDNTSSMMSECAGIVRNVEMIKELLPRLECLLADFSSKVKIADACETEDYFRFYQTLFSQIALCRTLLFSAENFGSSGSAVYFENGMLLQSKNNRADNITITAKDKVYNLPVAPVPEKEIVFEKLLNKQN